MPRVGPKVKVRVAMTPKLRRALEQLRNMPTASEQIKEAIIEAASIPVTRAKQLVPVMTGTLRDSIFLDARNPYRDPKGISVLIGINARRAPHWHLVEYGTKYMPARPYWRPALEYGIPLMRKHIRSAIYRLAEELNNTE